MLESSDDREASSAPTRRERLRAELQGQVLALARKQLRKDGPSGISLRAIARELGVTAPSLHYHYRTLCDLIDELREGALVELGDALEAPQRGPLANAEPQERLAGMLNAYRGWARANPSEFNLIWGPPVRGCGMPTSAHTAAFAQRGAALTIELTREVLKDASQRELVHHCFRAWTQIHGFVCLEVNGHFEWLGDHQIEAIYHTSVRNAFAEMGLPPPRKS
jgi:AcrR family transcriptional regulator